MEFIIMEVQRSDAGEDLERFKGVLEKVLEINGYFVYGVYSEKEGNVTFKEENETTSRVD